MLASAEQRARIRGCCNQAIMVVLMNVPNLSFGLSLGWVSLRSGAGAEATASAKATAIPEGSLLSAAGAEATAGAWLGGAEEQFAAVTFVAALLAAPLFGQLLVYGRKPALLLASLLFVASWSLTLYGAGGDAWWVGAARACAGFGGAGAWNVATLLAKEMCSGWWSGAGACAPLVAHNAGMLLMYLAADADLPHSTVEWWCLLLSAGHCAVFCLAPESPSYLAAKGDKERALSSLSWLRGSPPRPALLAALRAQPAPDDKEHYSFARIKLLCNDPSRRKALLLSCLALLGQETCGITAIMQFAEPVFQQAYQPHNITHYQHHQPVTLSLHNPTHYQPQNASDPANLTELYHHQNLTQYYQPQDTRPARYAVVLGATQLVASILSLYLVERVGRKPLLVWSSVAVGGCLAGAAALVGGGTGPGAAALALAGAVAADSLGLQPAPYAMLTDMFHYQWRGVALLVSSMCSELGSALQTLWFPLLSRASLSAALAVSAGATLAFAACAAVALLETGGKSVEQIYKEMGGEEKEKETEWTRF